MANAIKAAVKELFADISKSQSGLKRVLNPGVDGAGSRIFPSKTAKNDSKYGIRIDKGEPVDGKPNVIRLKLQLNSNATNKTIRDLAKKDSHKVVATVDVDTSQEANEENLEKVEDGFLNSLNSNSGPNTRIGPAPSMRTAVNDAWNVAEDEDELYNTEDEELPLRFNGCD
ncbi:MAG: hypothetical protein Q9177_000858 [Variospora cf. flavescens]